MNKLFTNKITLISFFVILCHFTVQAQDSAKKVIVVVRPGGITKTAPANTTLSASTTTPSATVTPASSTPALQATNKTNTAATGTQTSALASTAPATSKPKVAVTAAGTTAASKTAAGGTVVASTAALAATQKAAVVPYVAPGSRVSTYTAPNTAERTGSASYMHANVNTGKTNTTGTTGTVPASANSGGNASKYAAATSPAAGHANTAAAIVPPAKKDTVVITKLKHDTVDTVPAKHTGNKILFAEIGGPGIAISINYDQRFDKTRKDGFGFRAGLGYFAAGNNTVFTIPVQVNYLYGKDGKYLELGIGTTFINSRGDNYSSPTWEFDTVTGLAATAVIGVRYEPSKALNFRLGYVPIVSSYGLINAGGFSVGYTF